MSPLALRRKYLPRRGEGTRPPQAHPAAATATAPPQAAAPNLNQRPKSETEITTTSNGCTRITLTRFKPGFERDTENEIAHAFKRPPRMFKEDPPFYPWLPKLTPLVNFHLNFKG